MSTRKRISNSGMGRIWKNTLAQTVQDSVGARTKKDISRVQNSQNNPRKSLYDKERDTDDLDPANIGEALRNIRSLTGSGHDSDGSFKQVSHDDSEKTNDDVQDKDQETDNALVKNIVVKVKNDNASISSDHSNDRRFYSIREVRERKNDRAQKNEEINDGKVCQRKQDGNSEAGKVSSDMDSDKENPSRSGFDDQPGMDAYDKWKQKRQAANKNANFKGQRPKPTGPSPSNKQIKQNSEVHRETDVKPSLLETCTIYSSKIKKDYENIENPNLTTRDNSKSCTTSDNELDDGVGPIDSYDGKLADENMTEDLEKEIPASAMDKIQNLFQSYISPVTPRDDRDSDPSTGSSKKSHQKELASSTVHVKQSSSPDPAKQSHCRVQGDGASKDLSGFRNEEEDNPALRDTNITQTNCHRELEMHKNMESLQLTDDKLITKQNDNEMDKLEQDASLKNYGRLKYPPNVQSLVQSPASIPSGFSSDYDVGVISQSETEDDVDADDESPRPCVNLFPSSLSNMADQEHEQQEHQRDFSTPTHMSHWPRYYGNQPSAMPRPQMPYPLPPWFHPYYNHPDPYRHPYHPMTPQSSSSHPFMGTESSPFPGQQPPQSHQSTKSSNKLIIPADKFSDEDSIKSVIDFVAAKREQWDKFMIHRHGEAVPVDVVISVTLSGITTESGEAGNRMAPNPYSAHGGWPYPMYPQPNMAHNYHPYWSQHYGDENAAYSASKRMSHEARHAEYEGENCESAKVQHNHHHPPNQNLPSVPEHSIQSQSSLVNPHTVAESDSLPNTTITTDETVDSEDTMKRRSLTFDDVGSGSGDEQAANNKRWKNHIHGDDWSTPPRPVSSSTLSAATKYSNKYDLATGPSGNERDGSQHSAAGGSRFQHRVYRSNKHNTSYNEDEDEEVHGRAAAPPPPTTDDSTKTTYNQKSVCVFERSDSNSSGKRLSDGYEPISGKWADICPEPESTAVDNSYSSSSSQQVQDFGNDSQNRRRSDSVVAYGSDDRSPLVKDYRLSKTPGFNRGRMDGPDFGNWKKALMERCEDYKHQYIDTHCHLDFLYHRTNTATIPFSQYVRLNSDSFPSNYGGCVAVFCNPKVFSEHTQAHGILSLLVKEDNVWVAIGCHPKSATEFRTHHLLRMKRYLKDHPRVVALGEIGLDYSGTFGQHMEVQKEVFIQQLRLAVELKLPLVIHCRDADTDCLAIMKKYIPVDHKIHLHCFTRHISICRRWMEYFPNLFVGFTPLITYNYAREPTEAASLVPLDRLLLETDAPYFIPYGTEKKGISHPGLAIYTAERLAEIKNLPVDTVLEACRKNTRAMYGI